MYGVIETTYNGWSNRETWLVSLWLTSDEVSYSLLTDALHHHGTTCDKAERLEASVRQWQEALELEASLWSDLLGTALNRVNWHELVEDR